MVAYDYFSSNCMFRSTWKLEVSLKIKKKPRKTKNLFIIRKIKNKHFLTIYKLKK